MLGDMSIRGKSDMVHVNLAPTMSLLPRLVTLAPAHCHSCPLWIYAGLFVCFRSFHAILLNMMDLFFVYIIWVVLALQWLDTANGCRRGLHIPTMHHVTLVPSRCRSCPRPVTLAPYGSMQV